MKPALVVLAAGMGSRYGGIKQIDSIGKNDECLLDYSVFDAKRSGFEKVVYIIRKDIEKDFREKHFDRVAANFNAEYVFQSSEMFLREQEYQKALASDRKKPWGTVHAVMCAQNAVNQPFAVINADDYYGLSAYKTMAEYLSTIPAESTEYAMVGFELKNTMSRNGSVSRGICTVKDGLLSSIQEHKKIAYTGADFSGTDIQTEYDGKISPLTGNETVSMNMFGYSPKVFQALNDYWQQFKIRSISSQTDEALLPIFAQDIISNKQGSFKVFTSQESWFGMTYPQDKAIVKQEIEKKIATGYYPAQLWQM